MSAARVLLGWAAGCVVLAAAVGGGVVALNRLDEAALPADEAALPATPGAIARGEYLARAGNCMSCHTRQGGPVYAGGRAIDTPFGAVHASNLTPDDATGIGLWSASEFWRALHNGRSRDGRLLYPAFPYPSYTHITRADSDAIYAYLRSLPPVEQPNRPHALRFPFNTQAALAAWRALFFRPGVLPEQPARSAEWNRGAYLVLGLGHCAACHTPRNALGAPRADAAFRGGLIPVQNWYAPALTSPHEAAVGAWPVEDAVALLKTGVSSQATVSGPMAEVVFRSLQYLDDADLRAIVLYLRSLPQEDGPAPPAARPSGAVMEKGRDIYRQQCAQCHGEQGEGRRGAFPALAGNRAVLLADTTNLVQVVLQGGYLPATAGNPRPHGMPPFTQSLRDEEIASVLSYIRNAWGNEAAKVDTIDVYRARERRGS
ncbi:cytochrome c [Alicycliphilus denitrificans]|uniref:Cytochrome c n=1 Tax=Alicycliphilus denitrificans TaxID=179636 RepID=A0A420KHM0_9BURK|nr:cytochrome c [Alicycliphilus denitrificans]RKJ99428.1 cytochrome c [Alicycliphilus denitrificans]